MSKFIIVHNFDTGAECFINTEHILRVERNVIRFVDSSRVFCEEPYDEIKALLLDAQNERR